MASQGPNSPGTSADDSSSGIYTWTSPSNISSSDDVKASASGTPGSFSYTHYLKATNFGFSIPSGATIDGITVEVEKRANGNSPFNYVLDGEVKIVKGGTIQSTNLGDGVTKWGTADSYITYGSSSELWGTTWTDTDINGSDFGIVFQAYIRQFGKGGTLAYIDHVRITIYYTSGGGGGPTSTSALMLALD